MIEVSLFVSPSDEAMDKPDKIFTYIRSIYMSTIMEKTETN